MSLDEDALAAAGDALETEALRRVQASVLDCGEGSETDYTDALVMFLLRGLRPEEYQAKKIGDK